MFEKEILEQLSLEEGAASVEPVPINTLLGKSELDFLRECFEEKQMIELARELGKKLPDSRWFVHGILDQFYTYRPEIHLSREDYNRAAVQRESQLITLFLVYSRGQGVFLSIHFYWGLMMGLTPTELVQQVMLVGAYGGIQALNTGLTTLERTLKCLRDLASKKLARQDTPNPTAREVVRELGLTLGPILA